MTFATLVCLALAGILRLGSSIPVTEGAARAAAIDGAAQVSAWEAMQSALARNFDHPLGHLLVQLFVIVAVAMGMGALFTRLGQPAVIGEMAAGIMLGPSLLGAVAPGYSTPFFRPRRSASFRC